MSPSPEPLVSVVTPVYNGEADLRECIESVLAQTYTHWDYTIVDNCSTDRTLQIAREFAERDPRIRVITNEAFVPAVENHNIAFRQMSPTSRYCKMVQADDCLFPECIEKMVRLADVNPTVAIVGSYGLVGVKVESVGIPYSGLMNGPGCPAAVVSGRDACRMRLLGGPYVFGSPTSVLYRADIVRSRHAFYNESNIHPDAEVCFEFLESRDFGFIHQVLVFIRPRPNSLTSFSQTQNTYLPEMLYNLVRYGAKYLDAAEVEARIDEVLHAYYRYLGREWYGHRGQDFWGYHREQLRSLGYTLSTPRLAAAALLHALSTVLHPGRWVRAVANRLRQPALHRSRG